jgi:hypothetical protein
MMDNIPNLRLEVLIDYVLTKRNVCMCTRSFSHKCFIADFVSLSKMLVKDLSRCFSLLPNSADGKHVKSCVSSFAINSF